MLLVFQVSGQRFAVQTAWAGEVLPLQSMTRVPGAPAGVRGLLNLRGEVVAAIDLDDLTGKPATTARRPWAVVLRQEHVEAALLADSVEAVESTAEPEAPLAMLAPELAGIVTGTVRVGSKLAFVLDVPAVLRACASGGVWQVSKEEGTKA